MSDKYKKIADILCQLTDELAIDPIAINFNAVPLKDINLTSRIGSGLATYCKHNTRSGEYTITYGKKMIESKFNKNQIPHWLTYREIIKRNYFNGDTSLASVLAHTICHEFSHLIQQHNKWHIKGSVHNSHFYNILTYLHESNAAEKIRSGLIRNCSNAGISLEFEISETKKPEKIEHAFVIHDEISFFHKKKTYKGKIIKVNKKTIIVSVKSLFRYSNWKVPKHLAQLKTNG